MESPPDIQTKGTLSTSSLKRFAGTLYSVDIPRDHELTRAVEVGCDHYTPFDRLEDLYDLLIGQTEDSSHGAGIGFTGLLHRQSTLGDKTKTIFEAQGTCSYKR